MCTTMSQSYIDIPLGHTKELTFNISEKPKQNKNDKTSKKEKSTTTSENQVRTKIKVKRTNEKFRRYLGQQHVEEANKEYHEIMIKFETQISKTVNWMFLAFTLLNLPSKRDK